MQNVYRQRRIRIIKEVVDLLRKLADGFAGVVWNYFIKVSCIFSKASHGKMGLSENVEMRNLTF
jgi:hypothetical protein